jgi:hypothetical protein
MGDEIPGLKNGAEFLYTIYYSGQPAGDVAVLYEKTPKEPATVYAYGEVFGRPLEGLAVCQAPRGAPPASAGAGGLAEFIALGAALAVRREDDMPPYEFCFPAGGPACARWRGVKPIIAAGERRLCREYLIEPGPVRAFYTYDGILTRLEWREYAARIAAFPRRVPAYGSVPAAAAAPPIPEGGGE